MASVPSVDGNLRKWAELQLQNNPNMSRACDRICKLVCSQRTSMATSHTHTHTHTHRSMPPRVLAYPHMSQNCEKCICVWTFTHRHTHTHSLSEHQQNTFLDPNQSRDVMSTPQLVKSWKRVAAAVIPADSIAALGTHDHTINTHTSEGVSLTLAL